MLPIPFSQYIPLQYQDYLGTAGIAFCDAMDDIMEVIAADALELYFMKDPMRCPSQFLDEFGYYLKANILSTDTEAQKRTKIFNAVKNHKTACTWGYDLKVKIDAVTGYSSVIISTLEDDWLWMAKTASEDATKYWATFAAKDGGDADIGMTICGAYEDFFLEGVIFVDCHPGIHTSTLSAAQITAILASISNDTFPAYFRLELGYVNATGWPTIYAGGVLG